MEETRSMPLSSPPTRLMDWNEPIKARRTKDGANDPSREQSIEILAQSFLSSSTSKFWPQHPTAGQWSEDKYSVHLHWLLLYVRINTVCMSHSMCWNLKWRKVRALRKAAASNIKARATPCLYQRESVWTMKLEKHPVEILILRDLPRRHLAIYSSRVGVWWSWETYSFLKYIS